MKKIYFLLLLVSASPEIYRAQACVGTPASNVAIVNATNVCQGAILSFSLATTYTATGIMYQWAWSSLSIGPWTPISGATSSVLTTNTLSNTGYYTAVVACANSLQTITATPVYVNIGAPGSTTSVPYYEGFNAITVNNQLPNCSWSATSAGLNNLTFAGSLLYAAFTSSTLGSSAFYTEGIQLSAGIIYSVSLFYRVNQNSSINWSSLSLLLGPNQNSVGQTSLVTTASSPASISYQSLSTTFSVANSGVYFFGIGATCSNSSTASQLIWDDLSITIPCSGPGAANSPTVSITPASATLCAGTNYTFTASGANSYTWNNGTTGSTSAFSVTGVPNTQPVICGGTNTLTGCVNSATVQMQVNPAPQLLLIAPQPVCLGDSSTFQIAGAYSYTIIPNNGSAIFISPGASFFKYAMPGPTMFTLTAKNQFSCTSTGVFTSNPLPLPQIAITGSTMKCVGEQVHLIGSGAMSYTWSNIGFGVSVVFPATNSTLVTLYGSDGVCTTSVSATVQVDACTVLPDLAGLNKISIFPNPTSDFIKLKDLVSAMSISLTDVNGRILFSGQFMTDTVIDLREFSAGFYILEVGDGKETRKVKISKY